MGNEYELYIAVCSVTQTECVTITLLLIYLRVELHESC